MKLFLQCVTERRPPLPLRVNGLTAERACLMLVNSGFNLSSVFLKVFIRFDIKYLFKILINIMRINYILIP